MRSLRVSSAVDTEQVREAALETVTSALKGRSHRWLARLSGVSVTAVSRTFRGLSRPTVETLTRLAQALAVGLPDLLAYLETPPANSCPRSGTRADQLGPNAHRVITLHTQKPDMPSSSIALAVGISPTRVRQILAAYRRRLSHMPAVTKSSCARRSNGSSQSPAHVRPGE